MTEASHQITSNTAASRRAGSVGRPTGTEVVTLDERGQAMGPGRLGELAIRGESVTTGYLGEARRPSDAWLRTGDLGWIDRDGFVWLHARTKEAINRGGETIAPAEVEDALLRLPGVAASIAFGVPDRHLGSVVAALVVWDRSHTGRGDERRLRHQLLEHLGHRRVPVGIEFVDAIPLGRTGKPDRTEASRSAASRH